MSLAPTEATDIARTKPGQTNTSSFFHAAQLPSSHAQILFPEQGLVMPASERLFLMDSRFSININESSKEVFPASEGKVFWLRRALHGLKQSPRAWQATFYWIPACEKDSFTTSFAI